jgi:hypothetical protein
LQQDRPFRPRRRKSGGTPLEQYRLYFLGGDQHITHSHEFEAENDDRAIKVAEAWLEGRGAELWTGTRKIRSWEGGPQRPY